MGNREQGTGNREQGTGNREQGTGNREQGTGNRGWGLVKFWGDLLLCFLGVGGGFGGLRLFPEKEGTGETGDIETKFGLGDDILS
jgi:hypothetical protein